MANILVALCQNCFRNSPIRRLPLTSLAEFSRHSRALVSSLPMLQCKRSSSRHRSYFSLYSTLTTRQTFKYTNNVVRCIRKVSSSKVMYKLDERDKESGTNTGSSENINVSSSSDGTVSRDSSGDSAEITHFKAESPSISKPVSDIDVEKELLRYDYEEFELIPDEETSIIQPVKKSIPVELTSKFDFLFFSLFVLYR